MAIMAGTVSWFVRALLALVSGLALRFPCKKWAAAAALTAATFYLALWRRRADGSLLDQNEHRPDRGHARPARPHDAERRACRARDFVVGEGLSIRTATGAAHAGRGPGRRSAPSSRQGPRRTRNGTMTAVRTARTRARAFQRQSRRLNPSSGGSARRGAPARARGRGRRCGSRRRDLPLRAQWSRPGAVGA